MNWTDIPIDSGVYENVDETVLSLSNAAIENAYVNEAKGHSRFPGLADFVDFDADNGRVYLSEWKGDLIAATSLGNVYRINRLGQVDNVTKVPVSGGKRAVFTETDDSLLISAGGPIVEFNGYETKILSEDAPKSTHVAYVDGYVIAIEVESGRFQHADAGDIRTWDPLSTFAADSKPDNLNSMIVSPFRELLLCGVQSVEQYERLGSGETPFFRRWGVGEGVLAPYTLCYADNAAWALNKDYEFVRFSGQVSQPESAPVGSTLENISDWTDAWATPVNISGQRFFILQAPKAETPYGGQGLTLLFDYRQRRWYSLYAWNIQQGLPERWPGWSMQKLWGRNFVGCNGKICELTAKNHTVGGQVSRMLGRTAHFDQFGESEITNVRVRLKRGTGGNTDSAKIRLRCVKDNERPTRWIERSLGRAGDRAFYVEFGPMGIADTFQFEWQITDNSPVELVKLQVLAQPMEG